MRTMQNSLYAKKGITLLSLMFSDLFLQTQVIVIPDVHGRSFWKNAIEKHPETPIVFLGDYLNPYKSEGITADEFQKEQYRTSDLINRQS